MLRFEKNSVERQLENKVKNFEKLQVENQNLRSENNQFKTRVQDLQVKNQNLQVENQNMKKQIQLHCAQLLSNTINSNKNETMATEKKSYIAQKLGNSEAKEKESDFIQAEEFNFPDP